MKDEIIGGLRNALDRNETIEKAMQTFINAGYSATEVREAASMINPSATGMLYGEPSTKTASQSSLAQSVQSSVPTGKPVTLLKQQTPSTSQTTANLPVTNVKSPAQQNKGRKTAIVLAVILIILVIALGATIFFSQSILDMFSS